MESRLADPGTSIPGTSIIEQVISEAKKSFITGHDNNKTFKSRAEKDPALRMKLTKTNTNFAAYRDQRFQGNANLIPGSSFVAAAGPRGPQYMRAFFQDTIYNDTFPIKHILNLCTCTGYDEYTYQDFHDYCLKEREQRFGPYLATIKRIKGKTSTTVSGHQTIPQGTVQSQLQIRPLPEDNLAAANLVPSSISTVTTEPNPKNNEPRILNVTTLSIHDEGAIDLTSDNKDEHKETLWQIYQTSLKEPVLIHCASGVGRTGHMILMFEILKHHEEIFASNEATTIATDILRVLDRMRQVRPALVTTSEQFACSIRNADILYKYALKMKYIQDLGRASSIGVFSNLYLPQVFSAREGVHDSAQPAPRKKNYLL